MRHAKWIVTKFFKPHPGSDYIVVSPSGEVFLCLLTLFGSQGTAGSLASHPSSHQRSKTWWLSGCVPYGDLCGVPYVLYPMRCPLGWCSAPAFITSWTFFISARLTLLTCENSSASTSPSPLRSNILKAISNCLLLVESIVSRKM